MRITKNINSKTFYRHTKKSYRITHGNSFIFLKNAIWRHIYKKMITYMFSQRNALKWPDFRFKLNESYRNPLSLSRKPIKISIMPVQKVPGGYRWGQSGKVYPTKAQAEAQGRAIYASGYREKMAPTKKK